MMRLRGWEVLFGASVGAMGAEATSSVVMLAEGVADEGRRMEKQAWSEAGRSGFGLNLGS